MLTKPGHLRRAARAQRLCRHLLHGFSWIGLHPRTASTRRPRPNRVCATVACHACRTIGLRRRAGRDPSRNQRTPPTQRAHPPTCPVRLPPGVSITYSRAAARRRWGREPVLLDKLSDLLNTPRPLELLYYRPYSHIGTPSVR